MARISVGAVPAPPVRLCLLAADVLAMTAQADQGHSNLPLFGYHAAVRALSDDMLAYLDEEDGVPTWELWNKPIADDVKKWVHQSLLVDGPQPDGSVVVTVSRREHFEATVLGHTRSYVNLKKQDSKAYSFGFNAPERVAGPDSNLCEMAVARHIGQSFDLHHALWRLSEHQRNRGAADLQAVKLEVRAIRSSDNEPRVKKKDVEEGRWLVITMPLGPESYQVRIFGVIPAAVAWAEGHQPANWGKRKWDADKDDHAFDMALLMPCPCSHKGHQVAPLVAVPPPCAVDVCVKAGLCQRIEPPSQWRGRYRRA